MTIDLNRLKKMETPELQTLAKQLQAIYHHKHTKETLIENIINKVMEQSIVHPDKERKTEEAEEKPSVKFLTESEIEASLASLKERKSAFSTVYNHEDKCVVLRYFDGRYRHSETMSLSCPLTKIVRKATEIARGPLILPTHRSEDWERLGNGAGKNAYTEVVLG